MIFFNWVPYMQISDVIPGVNIISGKVSVANINRDGESGSVLTPQRGFRGCSTVRKFLGSKEHLDWLDIDLNVAKTITVQDYKHKKTNVNGRAHKQC